MKCCIAMSSFSLHMSCDRPAPASLAGLRTADAMPRSGKRCSAVYVRVGDAEVLRPPLAVLLDAVMK